MILEIDRKLVELPLVACYLHRLSGTVNDRVDLLVVIRLKHGVKVLCLQVGQIQLHPVGRFFATCTQQPGHTTDDIQLL